MTDRDKENYNGMSKEEKKEYEKRLEKEIEAEIEAGIEERLERKFGGGCGGDDGWWEDRSLPAKIGIGIFFGILGVAFIILCIFVFMLLWNKLMPEIFDLKTISFWQSAGLLLMSCILFKNWGFGDSGGRSERKRKRELKRYIVEEAGDVGDAGDAGDAKDTGGTGDTGKPAE